jgi:hypothetical protein
MGHGGFQTQRILKFAVGCLRMDPILLTRQYSGSLLWDLGVASLVFAGRLEYRISESVGLSSLLALFNGR